MGENPHMSSEANDSYGCPDLEGDHGGVVEATNSCREQVPLREPSTPRPPQVQSVGSLWMKLESRLAVGQVMKSVEDAYLLYCNYAHAKGFSVKKGDQRYFTRSSELQAKEFECSCEGVKDERRSTDRAPVSQNPLPRTKCKARLRVGRERGGEWKVTRLVMEHNHEMIAAAQIHLLRSSRNIAHAQKSTLEAMVNAGISVANTVSYMEEEVHGPQNLNFVSTDACDCVSRLRKHTKVENAEASELVKYLINKSNNEPFFYWDVQLDDDDRVMNFFFRDYRCKMDYECFGDVLLVDSTYRASRDNLICVPFMGINHHQQNLMFGLALLSDESEGSFEWLFRTFRQSMNGKQPETFSNQCQAMTNVIDKIFPFSHHRLCQWHINQNAPSYLGNLNCDTRFGKLWNKCMKHCDSEEEFEEAWKDMIDEFNLSGQNWLNGMYKLRHKWATAFSNHKFSAGLLTTCRSKGTSFVLEKVGNRSISLFNFVLDYEKDQKVWRENEMVKDARCRHGKPPMIVKNNPLLNHAADVYTINMYKLFESELLESLSTFFTDQPSIVGPFLTPFKVKSHGEESKVHLIPEQYIKVRWTKHARNKVPDERSGSHHISETVFVNQSMRLFYDLTQRCKAYEATRNMLTELLNGASEQVNDWFEHLSLSNLNAGVHLTSDEHNEMPLRKIKKGKGKGRVESSKMIGKGTKRKAQIPELAAKEFPSLGATHAPISEEADNVQQLPYPIGYSLQEASVALQSRTNQSHWSYPLSSGTIPVNSNMHLGKFHILVCSFGATSVSSFLIVASKCTESKMFFKMMFGMSQYQPTESQGCDIEYQIFRKKDME
ncbi:UNVERIFIED_CONTAM: protein FAR1-RELATED SEQUENCE 3 [Sesamum radiatum]|uniref:Protein FAR1-RELATED SEQUENCE 3 n=1 Tax=Sesamum radiatum TaxID=300843 RepID=A0AAW2QJX1_SESRA